MGGGVEVEMLNVEWKRVWRGHLWSGNPLKQGCGGDAGCGGGVEEGETGASELELPFFLHPGWEGTHQLESPAAADPSVISKTKR